MMGKLRSHFNRRAQVVILSGWILLGLVLRLTNLALKPPWSDEWATIVFSLGHSFQTIPINTLISLDDLLQPLVVDKLTQPQAVVQHLMSESTHPPLYFLLSHWWLQFLPGDRLISIWWARFLSALLGVAAIPAMYGLGWLWFRSKTVAQLSAALMAVSPWGIYLAQEARHYTLAILWVIASLAGLNLAVNSILTKTKLRWWLVSIWVIVNCLGVATHYFFVLTLVAEVLVLWRYWLPDWQRGLSNYWLRIYSAIAATICGCLVWLDSWRSVSNNQLTSWVFEGNPLSDFFAPLQRLLAYWITMLFILPVEGVPTGIDIISGIIILGFLIWAVPQCWRVINTCRQFKLNSTAIDILGSFSISAIALILVITYIFGADLSLSARFQYIYAPAILLLVAVILACLWQQSQGSGLLASGKRVVTVTLFLGLLGGLTIINNLAYQKVERPELVVSEIVAAQDNRNTPAIVATLHQTHGQTGEMMSLAWQFKQFFPLRPEFFLAHSARGDKKQATQLLIDAVSKIPRPFQLWLVNFTPAKNLETQN
nr:hypothetical protein [Pleurocapsa sp. MO_226.B13]